MGMPEKPQNGMNITPDGTVYEILDDCTIKRIGKVSSNGEFEPFGGPKDGIRVKNGFIYRVIHGKEQKVGRILPNGEIESISQKIKSEAEIARNKVKIIMILSILIALVIGAGLYIFDEQQQTKEELRKADEERRLDEEYENKIKPIYQNYLNETSSKSEKLDSYIKQLNNLLELQDLKYDKNKERVKEIISKIEEKKAYLKDRRIGNLIWSNRSSKGMNWDDAVNYCRNLSEGGFTDWRLPTISELKTTIKNCQSGSSSCRISDSCLSSSCHSSSCYCNLRANNGGYYSKLGDGIWLWSSSTNSGKADFAWCVNFRDGHVFDFNKTLGINVRCVTNAF